MARIQELLTFYGNSEQMDYQLLIENHPWITKRDMNCILSPDSDGFLCGLFMSNFLGWNIIGFYDGKVMLLKDGFKATDDNVCFLDMEIYRPNVRSIGHHMVSYNNRIRPENWEVNYQHCIQPNNIRNYDGKNNFRLKYPLATIHLLLGILGSQQQIEIPVSAIAPLFFTDGVFQVLYSYPENVLNWLNFLGINDMNSPLRKVFMHEHFSVFEQIKVMDDFFRKRDGISVKTDNGDERGDRLRISTKKGEVCNITLNGKGTYSINVHAQERICRFLTLLSTTTTWNFDIEKWFFNDMQLSTFSKSDFQSRDWKLTNVNFQQMMHLNPMSWAMTSGLNIEFTLETPSLLE